MAVPEGCGKISPPPGFDPRTVQPLASHYTVCDIPALNSLVQNEYVIILCLVKKQTEQGLITVTSGRGFP